jgi:hypothetical protein
MLAGEPLTPHGKGRNAYWRWYQRIERERRSGRLQERRLPGRRQIYFDREDIARLKAELEGAGVTTPGSRRRAKAALRARMEQRGLVPLPEAAKQLGLTPASLRSRVRRGTIEGELIDDQLFFRQDVLDAAKPRRAKATPGRQPVQCEFPGCAEERLLTASQRTGATHHFCSEEHRREWFLAEQKAGRITREGRPDTEEGRRRKSEATKRRWDRGELNVDKLPQCQPGFEGHYSRDPARFPEAMNKMTQTRYGRPLSEGRRSQLRALAGGGRELERPLKTEGTVTGAAKKTGRSVRRARELLR